MTSNLEAVHNHLGGSPQLTEEGRRSVVERTDILQAAIEQAPKSMALKTHDLIGDKVERHEDAEELSDRI